MRQITRRFILGGTAAIAAGSAVSVLSCRPRLDMAIAPDLDRLRFGLADIVAPERVGWAYRATRTQEHLLLEAAAKPGLVSACNETCPTAIRAALRRQAAEDFQVADVVLADRFVVARSECIVAALTALGH